MGNPSDINQQAISAALAADWQEAIKLNQQIIDVEPENVDALNRLARASFELGDISASKKHYEKALKLDPYNQIAVKFLKRIEAFLKKGFKKGNYPITPSKMMINNDLFIEEPGRTKNITLLKVAEPQKLSLLSSGELVKLITKNRGVSVTDQDGEYLGVLPDDISHQLVRLIKGGNKYQAIIKTIKTNGLSILVREVFRSARFKNQPSFLDNLNNTITTYSSDHIIVPEDMEKDTSDFSGEDSGESA